MKLGYTILYVEDVLKTVEFYERAFRLKRKMVHESNMYGEMETGETTLAFCVDGLAETHGFNYRKNTPGDTPAGVEIALVTDDVEAAFKTACDAGAYPQKEPETKPWGQTVSYVRDINGCLIEICSPIGSGENM